MKILVLGGNGFIGSHMVDKLLLEGHFVRVFDRSEEHYRSTLPEVDYHFGEFGNRDLLSRALKGIDIVVHLISTTLPKTSNDDPIFDIQSNVVESIFLLEQCVLNKIKKIIFTSSGGTVYGVPTTMPVNEVNKTNPICSYGIGKLAIEKYLYLFKQLYNLDFVIIRPSNPFGPRQNPYGMQGIIPIFLGNILKNIPIQIWGNGDIIRDYLHVEDLVDAVYRSILIKTDSHVFNIGSGHGKSINDLLDTMRNVTDNKFSVIYGDSRAFDVPEIYLDISRARKELDWTPNKSFNTGIKDTWAFIRNISKKNINV